MSEERRSGARARAAADHVQALRAQWSRELPDLDTEPMDILGRAYRNALMTRRTIEETFGRFGIDSGEFDVLGTLLRAGPPYRLTPTQIYTSLMLSSGGLTYRLNRLLTARLIAREPSASDGRSLLVRLTDKGRAVAEKAFRADMAVERQLLEGLSPQARRRAVAALRELGAVVGANLERMNGGKLTVVLPARGRQRRR